ncbi:putative mucin-associated surface protein (MASP), partial [Trypanosoma cruzi]
MSHLPSIRKQGHHHPRKTVISPIIKPTRAQKGASRKMIQQLMVQGHEKKKNENKEANPKETVPATNATTGDTATPGDSDGSTAVPTPPPLFCLFLLRVRLLLRWWPRESEGERAMHRPHTHSSFTHSLCVSPCMDSRSHLIPRGT